MDDMEYKKLNRVYDTFNYYKDKFNSVRFEHAVRTERDDRIAMSIVATVVDMLTVGLTEHES